MPRRRVSDQHIVLYRKKDRFIVTDLASTHGTFVGGRKIDRPTLLAEGESVVVGDFALTSQIGAPTRSASSEVWRSICPPSQERFERLRSMLYGERTEGAWMALCNVLDEWPEDEDLPMGLDYADAHLGAWDNALRRAPEHWKEPMIKGRAIRASNSCGGWT